VARVLERVAVNDPDVRVVDTHPLSRGDPNGVDIFYLMLVSTIIGFITVFQVRANASGLGLRHWSAFVVLFSVGAALVVTLVEAALGRIEVPLLETWGILALQILTVASFAPAAVVLAGRWAILPTWLFFVVLGNSAFGRRRRCAAATAAVRDRLAVAPLGGHGRCAPERGLLQPLPARAAERRAGDLGRGAVRRDGRRLAAPGHESGRGVRLATLVSPSAG
jgi:hypothetical protein